MEENKMPFMTSYFLPFNEVEVNLKRGIFKS